MLILAIEYSTPQGSVAISDNGRVLACDAWQDTGLRNNEFYKTLPATLSKAAISLDDVQTIAIGLGPGRFSNLRIALSTARGIAAPVHKIIYGITSVEALARPYSIANPNKTITVIGDARRNTIWHADFKYDSSQGGISETRPLSLTSNNNAETAFKNSDLVLTSEWDRLSDLLKKHAPAHSVIEKDVYPKADDLAELAETKLKFGIKSMPLAPVYMHPPVRSPVE